MRQVVRKLPRIPIVLLPKPPEPMLPSLLPLPDINLIDRELLHDIQVVLEAVGQERIDVLHWVETLHVFSCEMNTLTTK